MSLIDAKSFDDVINFSKSLGKIIVLTRGEKGAVAINGDEVVECGVKQGLKIVDLTGAGDLFAGGFLHGYVKTLNVYFFFLLKLPLPFLGFTIRILYFLVNRSLAIRFFLFFIFFSMIFKN